MAVPKASHTAGRSAGAGVIIRNEQGKKMGKGGEPVITGKLLQEAVGIAMLTGLP